MFRPASQASPQSEFIRLLSYYTHGKSLRTMPKLNFQLRPKRQDVEKDSTSAQWTCNACQELYANFLRFEVRWSPTST